MTVDLPYSVRLTTGGATRKGALACVDRVDAAQRATNIHPLVSRRATQRRSFDPAGAYCGSIPQRITGLWHCGWVEPSNSRRTLRYGPARHRAPFACAGLAHRRETECETAVTAGIDRQLSPKHMGKPLAGRWV
jgi:hypothetical protein